MQRSYYGLPAAPSVAEAIIQAQLLILKVRERESRNGAALSPRTK